VYQAGFRHWGKRDLRAQKTEEKKGIFFPSNCSPCLFFSSSCFSPAMPQAQTIPLFSLAQAMILEREVTAQVVTLEKRSYM